MSTTLGSKAVGSIVKLKENGTPIEFIVVNQGKPSSSYDDSCNGTWLLRRGIHSMLAWNSGSTQKNYNQSSINTFLNGTYLNSIEEDIRELIKSATISYIKMTNVDYPYGDHTDTMTCKVFLLSASEVWPYSNFNKPGYPGYYPGYGYWWWEDGFPLSYFYGAAGTGTEEVGAYDGSKHIAYYHYSPVDWYLRTGGINPENTKSWAEYIADSVNVEGLIYGEVPSDVTYSRGIRPAFILPQDVLVDDDGNLVVNQPPTAPSSIEVTNVTINQQATITLGAATDTDGTVVNYIYERKINGWQWAQFGEANSLTYTDTVQSTWATVAYRAKAVDDDGASGPYAETEIQTVNSGWVVISGPSASMGDKPLPFDFDFTVGISGQTGVTDINVDVKMDGESIHSDLINQGEAVSLYIDTRLLGAGQHTIQVSGSKSTYQSANQSYTFTVPAIDLPDEGIAEQPQNAEGKPVWWFGLARFIIGKGGKDVNTLIEELRASIADTMSISNEDAEVMNALLGVDDNQTEDDNGQTDEFISGGGQ